MRSSDGKQVATADGASASLGHAACNPAKKGLVQGKLRVGYHYLCTETLQAARPRSSGRRR